MPEKKVTISDIAAAAGVSKATVSHYINGKRDMMSQKTAERIQSVITMTNYLPSDIASNLKRKRTNIIGVLISDMSSPFSSALVVGISDYLEARGYSPLFVNNADSLDREKRNIGSLLSKGAAGLLVNTASYENNFLISTSLTRNLPIVLCDRYIKNHNFDIVSVQHSKYMFELVEHLKEQGYTRPVLFTQVWENNSTRTMRRESFLDAVQKIFGYDAKDDVYLVSRHLNIDAYSQLVGLCQKLALGDIPAIIGVNSVTTARAFHAIQQMRLRIPGDIGLCGPEDWDWGNELNWPNAFQPNVTTFKVPSTEIGAQAAKLLLEKIENPDSSPREILLPCTLNIRESTLRKGKAKS